MKISAGMMRAAALAVDAKAITVLCPRPPAVPPLADGFSQWVYVTNVDPYG